MCGVIVVDAESFRSTCLGRDAYIHDNCLGYHDDYLLFYQLPNSNLFTHRMLFSREKPLVKPMAPGSTFIIYWKSQKYFAAILLYLFYFILYFCSIYLSITIQFNLAINRQGIETPCSRWVWGFIVLCAGAANELLRDSPIGLITLVS
jgi:hypothetical protein